MASSPWHHLAALGQSAETAAAAAAAAAETTFGAVHCRRLS